MKKILCTSSRYHRQFLLIKVLLFWDKAHAFKIISFVTELRTQTNPSKSPNFGLVLKIILHYFHSTNVILNNIGRSKKICMLCSNTKMHCFIFFLEEKNSFQKIILKKTTATIWKALCKIDLPKHTTIS